MANITNYLNIQSCGRMMLQDFVGRNWQLIRKGEAYLLKPLPFYFGKVHLVHF